MIVLANWIILIVSAFILLFLIGVFSFLLHLSHKPQHAILRSHPILGPMRYILEKLGPEMRQYHYDNDNEGKPFSRVDWLAVVKSAKYYTDLISYGSQRDFEKGGYYLSNDLFPLLTEELRVDNQEKTKIKKYVTDKEGVFTRQEHMETTESERWLYPEKDALIVGEERIHPWVLKGMFGASATSYGAVGEHYILSTGNGAKMAGGSWINTGEGGLAPEHLQSGVDVIAQIGPGLFGYRDEEGDFSEELFIEKAKEPNIRAFELKFAQGAKIRGGHLEGGKVNEKVAAIRKVPIGVTVNSPNRFPFLHNAEEALQFVHRLQEKSGKPVGIKLVVGDPQRLEIFFKTMLKLNIYPDFFTIDGGEGGSGATFKSMADTMGLPLFPALIAFVDKAKKYDIRSKFKIFASGKLITADKIAIALAIGADAVNSARGFMIANGCIMAMQCHSGKCPTGIASTDPKVQEALVPDEKQWRVMNYILTVRQNLFALAAAAGLESPKDFTRKHVVFKDEAGNVTRLSEIFP